MLNSPLSAGDDGGTTIDQGSCMFGYLDPNKGTGRDIAALSDKAYDYAGRYSNVQWSTSACTDSAVCMMAPVVTVTVP